jgi:uncharacterized membrane protein YeaQ/YmgE (transglycosylase-associated protein family)
MGLISWIIFGALAGWVASIAAGRNRSFGCLGNIVIGVLGAFIGGFLVELFTGAAVHFAWNWRSFGVAVVGAVLLLLMSGWGMRRAG